MAAKRIDEIASERLDEMEPAIRAGAQGALIAFRGALDMATGMRRALERTVEDRGPMSKRAKRLLDEVERDFLTEIERAVKARLADLEARSQAEPKKVEVKVKKKGK